MPFATEDLLQPLYRQKADFSTEELQELQRKLEIWMEESRVSRLFQGHSRRGMRFTETDPGGKKDDHADSGILLAEDTDY